MIHLIVTGSVSSNVALPGALLCELARLARLIASVLQYASREFFTGLTKTSSRSTRFFAHAWFVSIVPSRRTTLRRRDICHDKSRGCWHKIARCQPWHRPVPRAVRWAVRSILNVCLDNIWVILWTGRRVARRGPARPVPRGACVEINQCDGCAMMRSPWLCRAVRHRHHDAIEQVSRRWRERAVKFDFHTGRRVGRLLPGRGHLLERRGQAGAQIRAGLPAPDGARALDS